MSALKRPRRYRTCVATLGSTALLASTLTAYGSLADPAWAASPSKAPEQLTMAIAWTGTQAAGVPPLLAVYNKANPSVHWNLVENVTEEKLLAEEAAGDAPSVAMLDTTNLVATMATTAAILPLKPYITSSKLQSDSVHPGFPLQQHLPRRPVRPPFLRGHLRPLLQQDPVPKGRYRWSSHDAQPIGHRRQEADDNRLQRAIYPVGFRAHHAEGARGLPLRWALGQ